jgi:two-component system chemotaxis response regulator CheY
MLTTESGADMKSKGKELGAKAWMVKPFQPEQLLGAVKKLLV